MWFDFARSEGYPTQYPANHTPVTYDVLEAGLIAAFIILLISFLISLPTVKRKTNISRCIRVVVILALGFIILFVNFGQEWEVGDVHSQVPYKSGVAQQINASLGIKIGLRSVNVTLKSPSTSGEKIDYNERFEWSWDQGRFGFGPYAGLLQREFREAQYRGLPIPILWIVDYFVIDGEGFRFGRFYRTAGWYCHILLWTAFASWILAIILFKSVIRYGAYFIAICGILQLIANLLWLVVRNPVPLVIPFEDGIITLKFGSSYWLTFASGILCVVLAAALITADYKFDTVLYSFFRVNPLRDYDEVISFTKEEEGVLRRMSSCEPGSFVSVYVKRNPTLSRPKHFQRPNKGNF